MIRKRFGTCAALLLAGSLALPSSAATRLAWKKVTGPEGGDIQGLAASGDTAVAVTAHGDYYRSDDAGRSWRLIYRSLAIVYGAFDRRSDPVFLGDRILGASPLGGVLIFQDGRTDHVLPEWNAGLRTWWAAPLLHLGDRIVALPMGIHVSADSGDTWSLQTEFVGGQGPVSAVAWDGTAYYAMNGGAELFINRNLEGAWSPIRDDLGREASFGGLTGMPGSLLAWWQDGEIQVFRRQGDSLVARAARLPGRGPWTVRHAGGKLLASGSSGISQSPDGGLTWTPLTGAPPDTIQALAELPGGDFLAGTPNGMYRWDRLAGRWSLSQAGLAAVEIRDLVRRENSLVALGGNSVYRSSDEGASWRRIPVPGNHANSWQIGISKLADLPPDLLVWNDSGKVFPLGPGDSLGADITATFPAPPRDLGRSGRHWVFMAADGATHVSHDDRRSWSAPGGAGFYHFRNRMAMRGARVILQGPQDSLRYSQDTGQTWKTVRMPISRNLQLGISGNAWLAVSGYLYRTEDPSAGWQTVQVGPTGTYPRALIGDGETLCALTDAGLYVSADHGATWESSFSGLQRGEFETLRSGAAALWAKAVTGDWWVGGLEKAVPTPVRSPSSPSLSGWPRVLRPDGRMGLAILDFRLADGIRLIARPFGADGRKLGPAIRREFAAGAHMWKLPKVAGTAFWAVDAEDAAMPGRPGTP